MSNNEHNRTWDLEDRAELSKLNLRTLRYMERLFSQRVQETLEVLGSARAEDLSRVQGEYQGVLKAKNLLVELIEAKSKEEEHG
jgi:hypothetical protein